MMMSTRCAQPGASRPLRLLYLVHQFFPERSNGTEQFVRQLARAVQARGHTAQVITYGLGGWRSLWRQPAEQLRQRRYTYAGLPVLALRHCNRPPNLSQQVATAVRSVA